MAAIALSWRLSLCLLLLALATSWGSTAAKDRPHLKCFYNSRANISCLWREEDTHLGPQVTSCNVSARSDTRNWNHICKFYLEGQASWACNLVLGKPNSQKLTAADVLNMSMVCLEGKGWSMVETYNFHPFENLRLLAPHSLRVLHTEAHRCNISWEVSEVSHYIEKYLEFEARKRSLDQSWEDVRLLSLKQWQQWLCLETLSPNTWYELQVRVKVQPVKPNTRSTWSPWSQPLAFRTKAWTDPGEKTLPLAWLRHLLLGLGCGLGFLVCVCLLIKCPYLGPWLKKALKCHIPDPSKFFSQLSSQHGGDLQKWLSSPMPSSSFSLTGPAPEISPLEVLDRDTKAMQLLMLQQDKVPLSSPGGHSQGSCFTNQGYFFFHLPDALEIESCQVYFTYDPCTEEDVEEDGPGLPEGSPLPPLLPLAGEQGDYCAFPPRDELMLFSQSLSSPSDAYGGSTEPEERPPLSLQEGLPTLLAPDLMGSQRPLELVLEGDGEGLSAHSSGEQDGVPEGGLHGQGQDRRQGPALALNTDAYLSLQELQAQEPVHLV
ncbi:interleukin-2 receptor subunit beta [Psammomys obesus]|uniref:interleukin-2 receptor subunit beta n=1 Tax=Psammomys obesus TaxID=48139 RepID=UPI0024528854|nr:interleukin-2 receptor subunit beta [Psammomys obesus]